MRFLTGLPNTHMAGESFVSVKFVSVLQYGFLEAVHIQVSSRASVVSDKMFDGFDAYFHSTVPVWEGN